MRPGLRRWSLSQLRRAAATFFRTRVENELDLGGTARGALMVEEEETLDRAFLEAVEAGLASRPKETAGAEELAKADRELNEVYRAATRPGPDPISGEPTPEGIRKAERAWLVYRDAWVAYGRALYPDVPPSTWSARITRERIGMLRENVR